MSDRPFTPKPKLGMNAHEVKFALHKMFPEPSWLTVEELFIHGFERYIDLWTIQIAPMKNPPKNFRYKYLSIHAIEVKVSSADFQREMKQPAKRLAAQSYSNYFSFAVPGVMAEHLDVPKGIGIIGFYGNKGKWIRDPEFTRVEPPRWELIAALGRSILKG